MSTLIKQRTRKSKTTPANFDFTGKNAVMVVDKKSTRTKRSAKKDCSKCKRMLPITDRLENSIDILESLSEELIRTEDCIKNDMRFVAKDGINQEKLAAMSTSELSNYARFIALQLQLQTVPS
ncbi:7043_t:CDS:2 [Paraglomus occultum]|uniref:7043_t:CDS:1 n=1 Tax=Paraglomus occultum TaxID=144539 RepID=A0A9N9A746_9GLOM|nr:7043_t:CDS:2 [Paraglomus occultum]